MEDVKQPTPEQIMNLGMAFWGSKTLLSAVGFAHRGAANREAPKRGKNRGELLHRSLCRPSQAQEFCRSHGQRYSGRGGGDSQQVPLG